MKEKFNKKHQRTKIYLTKELWTNILFDQRKDQTKNIFLPKKSRPKKNSKERIFAKNIDRQKIVRTK